jgi:hypothetical protein
MILKKKSNTIIVVTVATPVVKANQSTTDGVIDDVKFLVVG